MFQNKDNGADITNVWGTFEGGLEHRGRFGRQKDASSVLVEGAALLAGHYQLSDEARSVSDVVVLVVFAEVQDVLGQQLGLVEDDKDKDELSCLYAKCRAEILRFQEVNRNKT